MSLSAGVDALQPHVVAVAIVCARLLPVAFLCPLLGGSQAPTHVKLGVVLSLGLFLHLGAGVNPPPVTDTLTFLSLSAREILVGTTLGLLASLPFDTARMAGRFIDTFRGSSAEAALPFAGSKEAATGDALFHLLLSTAAAGAIMPFILDALFRSYRWAPLGTFTHTDAVATFVVSLVAGAFGTAFAIGAPIAALSLAVDTVLGLASRAASGMNLQDVGAPLRIAGGGAVLWLAVGLFASRLEDAAMLTPEALRALTSLGVAP